MATLGLEHTERELKISSELVTVLLAGAVSLVVWEIWAKVFAPLYMGGPLSPVGLVKSSLGIGKDTFVGLGAAKSGAVGNAFANGVHLLTGLIAYPLGYLLVRKPLATVVNSPGLWILSGALYGVALYVFAMYIMAHFVAGFPPFFGFNALSQASLIGHTALGLAIAYIVEKRSVPPMHQRLHRYL